MTLLSILIVFFIAIVLLFVELLLIPGFGFAGISSLVLVIVGIVMTFKNYGIVSGQLVLVSSVVFFIVFFILTLRQNTWRFLALKTDIDSKAPNNTGIEKLSVGQLGIAKTRLGPIGEIEVEGIAIEAQSISGIINAGSTIEIVKISNYKIIVKPNN